MTLKEVNLCTESLKMVKSKKDSNTPRKRNPLGCRSVKIAKIVSRPNSAVASAAAVPAANIRVLVRVRPPNHREQEDNARNVVKVIDDQMLIFDPKEDSKGFFFHGVQQRGRDLLKKANKHLQFIFDKVFPNVSTTQDVFKESTFTLIDSLMEGYNCSVFAYGATGAGKTFTMTGNTENPGITFLTMTELFRKQEELSVERDFELGITYLEVYNELVKDLLNPGPPLNLREDITYGVTVAGIKVYKIKSPDELFNLLEQGNKNRTQHPTDANAESSRSHAVFQVYIQMTSKKSKEIRRAKLSMIDLAGSERGSATGFVGARFTEGANINKSLLALGNCINSLADGHRHVPYRDSKLTRLLKDSLGGNCQTIMIANVSPSSLSYEDTYNTLKYAIRAKKIKSNIKQNVVNVEMHVGHYVKMVEELKKENGMLKRQLEEERSKNTVVTSNDKLQSDYDELKLKLKHMCEYGNVTVVNEDILNDVKKLVQEALDLVTRAYQIENTKNVTELKRHLKEEINPIMDKLCISTPEKNDAHKKFKTTIDRFKKQESTLEQEVDVIGKSIKDLYKQMDEIQEQHPQLTHYIQREQIRIGLEEQKYKLEVEKKQCYSLLTDNIEKVDLLDRMANVMKSCYMQLRGHGFVTSNLTKQYQEIIQFLQGSKKNVKFNDIPDSGFSSTTSIVTEENVTNGNKRKIEDQEGDNVQSEFNGTFTTCTTSTPNKSKSKDRKDKIISKALRPPPSKRIANGRISPRSPKSPRNKENHLFKKPYETARSVTSAKVVLANRPIGLRGTSKTPPKPKAIADRPRFRT